MEVQAPRLDLRCVSVCLCLCVCVKGKRAEGSSVPLLPFLVSVETQERPATELMLNNELDVVLMMCIYVCMCVYI